MLLYTPHRTHNKIVYDFADMNDGELLFSCGTWNQTMRPLLAEAGGIEALLPILENIKALVALQNQQDYPPSHKRTKNSDLVNDFLKLALAAIGNS